MTCAHVHLYVWCLAFAFYDFQLIWIFLCLLVEVTHKDQMFGDVLNILQV